VQNADLIEWVEHIDAEQDGNAQQCGGEDARDDVTAVGAERDADSDVARLGRR
jgi:hypothetical protein